MENKQVKAISVIRVTKNEIEKLNLISYSHFMNTLEKHHVTLDTFAISYTQDVRIYGSILPSKQAYEDILKAFQVLQTEFKQSLHIGLDIEYFNPLTDTSDDDSLKDAYFTLNPADMYELNMQAKMLQNYIDFKPVLFTRKG